MMIEQATIDHAIQYLVDGQEFEAARILRTCELENSDIVDFWMDGNRQLDGLSLSLRCPRASFEILRDRSNPISKSIHDAVGAVLPNDMYLKVLSPRAVSQISPDRIATFRLSEAERKELISAINLQKSVMIAVATGGPRIKEKDKEYQRLRAKIGAQLSRIGLVDPNPFTDLWAWYGRWSDGSLQTYQSRRRYITDLFHPLLSALENVKTATNVEPLQPTGWARVDRGIDSIRQRLETAQMEEDFQTVGLLCRESLISLAQAVYDPKVHDSCDGVKPSSTDANRMLEAFIVDQLPGGTNEAARKHAKAVVALAVQLQHKRTAKFRDAALCAEATRSVVNLIAIISGRRDP